MEAHCCPEVTPEENTYATPSACKRPKAAPREKKKLKNTSDEFLWLFFSLTYQEKPSHLNKNLSRSGFLQKQAWLFPSPSLTIDKDWHEVSGWNRQSAGEDQHPHLRTNNNNTNCQISTQSVKQPQQQLYYSTCSIVADESLRLQRYQISFAQIKIESCPFPWHLCVQ